MNENFYSDYAHALYEDMAGICSGSGKGFENSPPFNELEQAEKDTWHDYAASISSKLGSLSLISRPYLEFCATCIITGGDLDAMVSIDKEKYSVRLSQGRLLLESGKSSKGKEDNAIADWFLRELNCLIPLHEKNHGREIVRNLEASSIDTNLVRKIARAVHSRFLKDHPGSSYASDFDALAEDVKQSNFDNAWHIPAKLLAIGYRIRPLRKGFRSKPLSLNRDEVETMAEVEHIRWYWNKRLNGWRYGINKDSEARTHPSLVAYEMLHEDEKEKDRELVRNIPALLADIGYEAYHIDPARYRELSYAIKPQSSIHKILQETRELNEQIRKVTSLTPETEEMVEKRNYKIEDAIREVTESYNYAHHIQKAFLPDSLYVRECFPDSFLLFLPRDIVSGDFYFVNRRGGLVFFAAADCTGKGIPGAMLSTIGYGILDQAINEAGLTDPADILHHLYSRMRRFLHHNDLLARVPDDLDIALCILDRTTRILTYAGVKNPLYYHSAGEMRELKAQNLPGGSDENRNFTFLSDSVTLDDGDTVYVFSDGFADQFGGPRHKRYQSTRLKAFLESIHNLSMEEQNDRLFEEFESWKNQNSEDQTDDVLVMGVRI